MGKFITSDKVFYHLDRVNNWKNNKPVGPITTEIHLTNRCNNKCYYCIAERLKDGKEMSESSAENAIKFFKEIGGKAITFSGGGEPTVSPHFSKSIRFAKSCGLDVGVISNGVNVKGEIADDILDVATWCRISFDSNDSEVYHRIRGTWHFEEVVKNIGDLLDLKDKKESKTTIGLQIVVNKYNYRKIREIVNFLIKQFPSVDYIQVRPLEISQSEEPYSLDQLEQIKPQLNQVRINKKVVVSDKWDLLFDNPKREFGFSACHCIEFIGAIDAYGDWYLCCHTVGMEQYKICNVFKTQPHNFQIKLIDAMRKLGKTKGLNPRVCPVGCRGSTINRCLEGLLHEPEHKNFL